MPRNKPPFSKSFDENLLRSELIQEMMVEDGWAKQDEDILLAQHRLLDMFYRHAEAAIRVMQRIEDRKSDDIKPSEMD